jgi:triphosphoribosyl-dephospho-CoA synthase
MSSQISIQHSEVSTWLTASYGMQRCASLSPAALALCAVQALVDEAELTPKPALVDMRGSGAHRDLSLSLLVRSAQTLGPWFLRIAQAAHGRPANIALRERLGLLGREAEDAMMNATEGVNTHRGAIWALGLLVAAASQSPDLREAAICRRAALLASLPDRNAVSRNTHGTEARRRYGAGGARSEAEAGFPNALHIGLPALHAGRHAGHTESHARLDALLSIMTTLEDTCLLHRGGAKALKAAHDGAARVLALGGASTIVGMTALLQLHDALISLWASPGGSADMLSATLFLDRVSAMQESNE